MNKVQTIFLATCLIGLALQPAAAQGQFQGNVRVLQTWTGPGNFGWTADAVADISGDGIPEMYITAPFAAPPSVFIYDGVTGALLQTFTGAAGTNFGYDVADVGDVDGDGISDIIVAATLSSGSGQAFVYSMGPGFPLLLTLNGEAGVDLFGSSVHGAGDIDGDEVPDLLVGAELNDVNGNNSGRVYVFSGADGSLIHAINGPGATSFFGTGVAPVEDVNGDGVTDHIIGARGAAPDGQGKAYVHSGADGSLLFELIADPGWVTYGQFFVADLGDVDGDGTHDIYVADYSHASGQGRAYVFSGKDGTRIWTFVGGFAEGAGPGRQAGDVNNDGFADIIVAHWTSPLGGQGAGRALVYSGADGSVLTTITSQSAGENFGFDAVGVGDIDGDGMDDYLITAATLSRTYLIAGDVERQPDPEPPEIIVAFMSGSWFDLTHEGEGFLIEVINETTAVVYWFTYDEAGNQRWFFGVGTIDGTTIQIDELFVSTGGVFGPVFDPAAVVFTIAGSLTVEIFDCETGKATYTINDVEGMQDLTRITSLSGIGCDEVKTGISAGLSGSWFDPSHDGEGFLVEVLNESTVLVYWFSYDDKGNQAWFVGVGSVDDKTIVIEDVLMPTGGLFGPDFDPETVELIPWGEIRFELTCEGGNMTYSSLLENFGKGGLDAVERITAIDGLECP